MTDLNQQLKDKKKELELKEIEMPEKEKWEKLPAIIEKENAQSTFWYYLNTNIPNDSFSDNCLLIQKALEFVLQKSLDKGYEQATAEIKSKDEEIERIIGIKNKLYAEMQKQRQEILDKIKDETNVVPLFTQVLNYDEVEDNYLRGIVKRTQNYIIAILERQLNQPKTEDGD